MTSILIFAILTIISALGVWIIRQYAERRRIMDHPNERSSHSAPTPRGGGLAIVIVVLAAGCVTALQTNLTHNLIYLVCGAVIAYLGWRDDLHSLSPRVRFAVQGLVALASVLGMGYFKSVTIPLFGQLPLGAVGFIITLLWIVGLTNAYNFMDGIDGIAGGVALSAAFGWMFLATRTDNHFVYWIALAIAAGSLGFLFHNWSPAKIFMGDAGSTFLGYTFAVLPLLSADEGGDALMLGTLLMWTFIMDAGVTFIRRALKRENVFAAHRTHLYQRLIIGGYKHAQVSALYILLTLLAAALAYAWSWGQPYAPPVIIIGLPLIWLTLSRYARSLKHDKGLELNLRDPLRSFVVKMFNRIKNLASLYLELGPRWSAFRLAYAFRLRSGLIRLQTPQYKWDDRPLKHWLKPAIPSDSDSYAQWRKQNAPKFFFDKDLGGRVAEGVSRPPVEEANRLLNGELKYFSHGFHKTGFPPNWHKDPITNYQLPTNLHWSQISDDSTTDIKFIWEPNRFAFVYTLVRAYAATQDEKYPQAFWQLIQDWAENNPPNTGANWKDGQEIALRLMAWTFGFYAFINSPSTTPEHISQFTQYIAAQAERIHANIGYAISTRSNHTISEAFGLWMVGLLFPELKEAEKYFTLGKRLLEEEAKKQILPDGSYAMYSLNYHRFILHLYLYAIQLGELNQLPFTIYLKNSISKSISFLSHLIDPASGYMPVYGSNDGALVLPLNNCDFTDYRPLLQLGSVITTGKPMFESGTWDEDVFWLCGEQALIPNPSPTGRREQESPSPFGRGARGEGGTYILRNDNSRAILRCTDFTSRPSHADQLHMDLWMGEHNIAIDAGTYLYSGEGIWRNGLARTSAHNTVTVDGKDQMTLVSRFTWTNWAKGKVLKHTDNLWQGEHDGYKPVRHKRTVMALEEDRWLVIDDLESTEPHHYTLHWLLNDGEYGVQELSALPGYAPVYEVLLKYPTSKLVDSKIKIQMGVMEGEGKFSILRADPNSTRGWRSRYYGHKEPAISLLLEAHQPTARFWTFFGFGNASAEPYLTQIKRP